MARTSNNQSVAAESKTAEMKRTTYKKVVNVVNGDQSYMVESRAYGEGPIVALKAAIQSELDNNPGAVLDKSTITIYGAEIQTNVGRVYVSVIHADAQCPRCGAPRGKEHAWCPSCTGKVDVDLDAELQKMMSAF